MSGLMLWANQCDRNCTTARSCVRGVHLSSRKCGRGPSATGFLMCIRRSTDDHGYRLQHERARCRILSCINISIFIIYLSCLFMRKSLHLARFFTRIIKSIEYLRMLGHVQYHHSEVYCMFTSQMNSDTCCAQTHNTFWSCLPLSSSQMQGMPSLRKARWRVPSKPTRKLQLGKQMDWLVGYGLWGGLCHIKGTCKCNRRVWHDLTWLI